MSDVNAGLIGAGLLGLTHAFCLKAIGDAGLFDVEVTKVYDPNHSAADSLVENMGVKKRADSAEEIFGDDRIDTIYIATPTIYHKDYVVRAAERGKNVFCEKPLYINYKGAKEMAAEVERAGVAGGVGLVMRYSPTLNYILDKMENFDAGRPILFSIRDDQCLPIRGLHHTSWRSNKELSGGGTLIEHSIHDIDLFGWFFGDIVVKDVEIKYHPKYKGIDNYVRIVMGLGGGGNGKTEGILTSVWHDMVGRASNRRIELIFERLFIGTDHDFLGPVELTEGDGETLCVNADEVLSIALKRLGIEDPKAEAFFKGLDYKTFGAYTLEDYFFIKAVAEGGKYQPGFDAAVSAHRLVEEIYNRD
ncbi:MAG: Gfo/Idh/MocA family oxidoreductase [Deltaproteobacteria bacterium]|uniref:Gfo/Idh/MocA family oxidoreductase n=1 Tax=Candidatus Zymogenus saltonus TaxID=2844893 RepID=A0A9D8KCK7_9DELT|nr:Gfo/Idh/MocA family oxidoreductase [Candidatus Zymogenus saltonus]